MKIVPTIVHFQQKHEVRKRTTMPSGLCFITDRVKAVNAIAIKHLTICKTTLGQNPEYGVLSETYLT